MTYNEIKFIAESKNLQMMDLDQDLDLARNGLKRSFERQTLPMSKVLQLCQILGISPNELFGWEEKSSNFGVYASNISGVNNQNSNEAIKALKEQLKEKDKQISRLLSLLEKGTPLASKDDGVPFYSVAAESPAEYSKGGRKK